MNIQKNNNLISNLEDWFNAAPPQKGKEHWVDGRSAKECALAWLEGGESPRIPAEIGHLLDSNTDLAGWRLNLATPEHRVKFDRWGEPRHTDMAAWGQNAKGDFCMHIEAKADEQFDRKVSQVLGTAVNKIANEENTNAIRRVEDLATSLLTSPTSNTVKLGELRYQLLTALAGLLADAQEKSNQAVFVVHEFITDKTTDGKHEQNHKDLDAFVARISGGAVLTVTSGKLYGPFIVPSQPLFTRVVPLYIGKATRILRKPVI